MRIFWKETVTNRLRVGGSAFEPLFASGGWGLRPKPLRCYSHPTITTLSSSFLALNAFYYPEKEQNNNSKCSVFDSSAHLHLFSTLNSVVLLTGGARIFLAPERRVPSDLIKANSACNSVCFFCERNNWRTFSFFR